MTGGISSTLVLWCMLSPALLVTSHILLYRVGPLPAEGRSSQAFLAKLIVAFNVPTAAVAALIGMAETRSASEVALMMLFAVVVFNCAAYAYFHVFNMSETARRVRMLLQLYEIGGATAGELLATYSPTDMIAARLARLLEMRQIACHADGRYYPSGHLLLWTANAIEWIRRLLGFDRSS